MKKQQEFRVPGTNVPLNATANVTGDTPLYVFVKLDIPSAFSQNGFNSSSWHPIEDDSTIYYYGTATDLGTMYSGNPTATILNGITLSVTEKGGKSYTITITGYAIQAENISSNTAPKDVFTKIRGN